STYLLTIRLANRPGPGNPRAMGAAGFVAATTTGPGGALPAPASGRGRPFVESLAPVSVPAGLVEELLAPVSDKPGPGGVASGVALASGCVMGSRAPLSRGLGSAAGAGSAARAAQAGQAYLWTRCSQTNKAAGCQSSCSLVWTPMGTRNWPQG